MICMKRILPFIMLSLMSCTSFVACTPGEALPDAEVIVPPEDESPDLPDIPIGPGREAIKVSIGDKWTQD